jgi:hypothetical protein
VIPFAPRELCRRCGVSFDEPLPSRVVVSPYECAHYLDDSVSATVCGISLYGPLLHWRFVTVAEDVWGD